MLFVGAAMAATFLLVPRGFSAGEIDIQSDHMSWNTTKGTYQLNLLARIPVNNPNFLRVRPTLWSFLYVPAMYKLNLLARIPVNNPSFLRVRTHRRMRCCCFLKCAHPRCPENPFPSGTGAPLRQQAGLEGSSLVLLQSYEMSSYPGMRLEQSVLCGLSAAFHV